MRKHKTKFAPNRWPVNDGPLVVLGESKNVYERYVFNTRDGPKFETGPPGGTGPPCGTGPPSGAGPPGGSGPPSGAGPLSGLGPLSGTGPPDNTGLLNGKSPPLNKKANVEIRQQRHRKDKTKTQISFEEIKKMKHLKLKRLYGLILIGCFSILHVPIVFAAASDNIDNMATLTFTVGGGPANTLESDPAGNTDLGGGQGIVTRFKEDREVNFTVAENGDAASTLVAPSSTLQVQTFTVTNNGNGTQDFLLMARNTAGTADPWGGANDSFDPVSYEIYVETLNGGAYVPADDDAIFIDELAPLGVATVYIVSTIPAVGLPLANGDTSVMALVVQVAVGDSASGDTTDGTTAGAAIMNDTNDNASVVGTYNNGVTTTVAAVVAGTADDATLTDIVFNDPAGVLESDGTAGAVQNGQHSAYDTYEVGAAEVSVTKTAAILWDPVNGALANDPKAIPGAYMRYTITITNAGTAGASADLTTLVDDLQNAGAGDLVLDPDYVDGSAAAGANAAAILATTTNGAGESFDVALTGTTRTVDPAFCSGDTADGDADGCGIVVATQVTTITFTTLLPIEDVAPPGAGVEDYTAGELKPGDTVTIMFNAIVQ